MSITALVRFIDAGACFAIAMCCFSRVALGEPVEEPLRLEYRASAGCDDEQQFLAALRARAPRARLARSDEAARVFNIEIEQGAKSTRARLTIREPNGQRTVRDVETRDCREAIDALALIAALAVDPQGVAESARAASRGPETKSTPGDRSEPAKPPPAPSPAKPTDTPPVPTDRDRVSGTGGVASPAGQTWIWAGNVAGSARAGVAPGLLWGGRLGIGLERQHDGWWAPSVRVSAEYVTRNGFALEGGTATFAYAAGSVQICPLRLPRTGSLVARPCFVTDLGVLHGSGSDVLNPRSANRTWWAVGGLARLEWLLTARIGVELEIGCTFPVWRDRFRFDPRLVYEVAKVSGVAALGVTVHFP